MGQHKSLLAMLHAQFFHKWVLPGILLFARPVHAANDLLALKLEDLSQIPIVTSVTTLTDTAPEQTPVSTTTISHQDIIHSGARNLDELLDIFVPGLAYSYKVLGYQLGIQGIISDRNNKILLIVNGRNMNIEGSDGGAVSERWFSTLGDIRRVTVINGPGSVIYGPGAIAGVIYIETFSGGNFEGTEASFRNGSYEEFVMAEIRHGRKLDNGMNLFVYYGFDDYSGAEDAPLKAAFDLISPPWNRSTLIEAYEDFPFTTVADGASFQGLLRHKLHLQLDNDNFTAWLRYTRSGLAIPTYQGFYEFIKPDIAQKTGAANQQLTLNWDYRQVIDENLDIKYSLSHLLSDIAMEFGSVNGYRSWREEDTTLRMVARYTPDERHSLAIGAEYVANHFGKPGQLAKPRRFITSDGQILTVDPDEESLIGALPPNTRWKSHMTSLFGEYQWHYDERWVGFAGLRADKHSLTQLMISPRLAIIYQPQPGTTWKFNMQRSVRHADDADLYKSEEIYGRSGDIEKLKRYELSYSHRARNGLQYDYSLYYNDHTVVAYNTDQRISESIGNLNSYGVEARMHYAGDGYDLFLSHNYTQQLDFDLIHDIDVQNISAAPYGYGNDLLNWNNHITKLRLNYQLGARLEWVSSLRIYWGMPGAVDMADYNKDQPNTLKLPLYDGSKRAFEESLFLNTGLVYGADDRLSISFHAYNLLGLIDEDYNKRNFVSQSSLFRDQMPSLALRLSYRFR